MPRIRRRDIWRPRCSTNGHPCDPSAPTINGPTSPPDRVAIEKLDGTLVAERLRPERSFDGHVLTTPWDPLQRAYFNGYALWTVPHQSVPSRAPGIHGPRTRIPVVDNGITNHRSSGRLPVRLRQPQHLPGVLLRARSAAGTPRLPRRRSRRLSAIQYVSDLVEVNGIRVPTKRRAYRRDEDGRPSSTNSWSGLTCPTSTSYRSRPPRGAASAAKVANSQRAGVASPRSVG